MIEPAPRHPVGAELSVEDTLHLLRTRVLGVALNVLAIAMPLVCMVLALQAYQTDALTPRTIALCSWGLAFPLLRLVGPRLAFRTSALLLMGVLIVSAAMVALRGGLTVGCLAVCVLLVLLATLFFGRRGAVLALLAVIVLTATSGFLVVQGYVPSFSRELFDPLSGAVWVRQIMIMALLGVVMAATELYVVERLAHQVEVHRSLAAHEREQRLALERSERERMREREQREQAQLALERSRRIEALARMAGGVAHDFNNALTVIIGGAEMARNRRLSPAEVDECLSEVLRAAGNAAELARRLLTLGRQQISKPRPTSMAGLLGRLQASIRRILAGDVQLVVTTATEDAIALVDEAELERALLNLVLNAGEAMPRGGTLSITWRAEDVTDGQHGLADGRYVSLSVSDSGEGMNRETLDRIFDPFFTTKGDKGGTGLGLATVYAFAKESHGTIGVTSAPGAGTTFTMLLPEYTGVPPTAPASVAQTTSPASPVGGRVLVVEDRPDVRASMARILSHHGFDVTGTSDGDGALRLLSDGTTFTLMCVDGVMPGLETAAVIERAKDLAPSMPVLVCSGHVQEELLRRGIATGRYAFLSKPFSAQQLIASVAQVLGSTGDANTLVPPSQE
jgi:signal transduction histidine kinase/CheY-like chemotaxis protein